MITVNKPIEVSWENLDQYDDYLAEPKLDGMRCLLFNYGNGLKLIRENGTIKNKQFPEVIKELEGKIPEKTILDGELCVLENEFRADFRKLLRRVNLQDPFRINLLSKKFPTCFVAFDVLYKDGKDLKQYPLFERKAVLETIPVKRISMHEPNELKKFVEPQNMEGIILKKNTGSYESRWFKLKNCIEKDFVVIGINSQKRMISSLKLADSDGKYVGDVNYIGYPQTEKFAKKVVGMVAVVRYLKSDVGEKVRFPVLKELR